ncbi:hypothetical protein GCM10009864_50360 [Streptomyces lunalinharesii]|uniref:Integrase catalytic domain-containing protein n=1 Tax=Streptomyces lunalinharesii TaxID=333384 RepID=A0ABP6ERD6_9ACTN
MQVGGSWLYLACVIDICSRRVLGYSMAPHMRAELVIDAIKLAVAARGDRMDGVIFPGSTAPRSATSTSSSTAAA